MSNIFAGVRTFGFRQNGEVALHSIRQNALQEPSHGTLVLLHGLGADEYDLMGLSPYMGEQLDVLSLRAPMVHGPGFSWFDIEFDEESVGTLNVNCDQARDSLIEIVNLLAGTPRPLWLAGFSQGAMMAIGIWLEHGNGIDGVIAMSGGWLPCFDAKSPSDSPILMTHGEYDALVPVSFAIQSYEQLRQIGADAEFRGFPMAHEISEDSLRVVATWLERKLAR